MNWKNLLIFGLVGLVVALLIALMRRPKPKTPTRNPGWADNIATLLEGAAHVLPFFSDRDGAPSSSTVTQVETLLIEGGV